MNRSLSHLWQAIRWHGDAASTGASQKLRELGQSLMSKPELSDINIIRANINLDPLHRIAARHGFETIHDPVNPSPWERVHRFGQNILYWLLTLACNSGRARPNKFWRSRQLLYLSRRLLDCNHSAAKRGHNHHDAHGVA